MLKKYYLIGTLLLLLLHVSATNDLAATLTVTTIIAKNIGSSNAPADVGGTVVSQGNNLIGDTAGGFGFAGSDLPNMNRRLGGIEGHAAPGECRVFNSIAGEATISGLRISNGFQSSGAGGGPGTGRGSDGSHDQYSNADTAQVKTLNGVGNRPRGST